MTTDKYDRQLRLWGVHGQRLLRQAKVCLLGSSSPGVQALKSLILPAVGNVCIWDDATTIASDLGSNFFLTQDSIGKPRASQTLHNLLEMNPQDVKGQAIIKPIKDFLNKQAIIQYSIIISNQQSQLTNIQLSQLCFPLNIPVIYVNTYGFFGYVRNEIRLHEVYQNKELKKVDLRLSEPFKALNDYVDTYQVEQLLADLTVDNVEKLTDIPFAVLIVSAMRSCKSDKVADIRTRLREWKALINAEDLENFDQALSNLPKFNQTKKSIIESMEPVLNHPEVATANENSRPYWILVRALKEYINKYGDYPQLKEIPDMRASSKSFISLKEVYLEQHNKTKQQFIEILKQLFPTVNIQPQLVTLFIENLTSMEVVEMRPFFQELQKPQPFEFENNHPMLYVGLRGADLYRQKTGRFATRNTIEQLKNCIEQTRQKYYPDLLPIEDQIVKEIARVQGSEMVSISALIGSVVAQQAIKLITHQFTPSNGGYFYDGLKGIGSALQL